LSKYTIKLSKRAEKQLDKLSDKVTIQLSKVIFELGINPRPFGYIKLKGRNAYRIRKGNYRIIYEIFDDVLVVKVITIGDRKDVY